MRQAFTSTALAALMLGAATPVLAQSAEAVRSYDIPAGPLDRALPAFAQQSGLQLLYPTALAAGRWSAGVSGAHTAETALGLLLRDTGLTYRQSRPTVFVLIDPAARAQEDAATPVLDEVVVTGTYLRGADSPSPVTVLTQADVDRRGRGTLAETLAALPQNFTGAAYEGSAGTGADRTNRNTAYATGVNLRGLGADATLVLVNGRRIAGTGGAGDFADVSNLPSSAIARTDVLLDGASALYQGEINPTPPTWMGREATDLALAPQLLVAAGYAILIPDLPPTPEPADGLAQRLLAVVDAAAAEGLIDADRIGLWGWSFGAWSAVMSAAQSPRFDAVVALNGPMNFSTVIGDVGSRLRLEGGHPLAAAASARWLESGQAAMGEAYWRAPDRYRRNSPFDQADRITAPVLLVAGEDDLMLGQTEQMYGALHRLGRPVALTLLIGEGHGIQNPGNARLYYEQVRTWFDRHLRPDAGPDAPATGEARPPSGPD